MLRGLMTDEEWALFELFVTQRGPKGARLRSSQRLLLDGVFWIAMNRPRFAGGLLR